MKLFTLPNLMTLGNLLCGCLGILAVGYGQLTHASVYIAIALVLDFGDGFVARALNAASPIGKELDSLADVVTFGVLPSFIMYSLLQACPPPYHWMPYVAFILALFSALRLAKFNIDTRQSDSFIGVPTPANAMVVAALPMILVYQPQYATFIENPWILVAYSVIMSWLLIAEFPLFSLKFKSYNWADNRLVYSFLLLSVLIIAALGYAGIPVVILLYIFLSLVAYGRQKTGA